ncbi:NepR family anti-sigma factor [Devosia rhodophyticola]|uniref:NepR family anti-sigma factor n=2 Tax=Devosia rhodophyticola TaxID=3026423 RepID=A0ABY7Z2A8_9HYPH|nr:NepR family anti-sigma factor [Devosia rhodophyticola]WDR07542.1 NepR family anti-sigma factor [Devosia rhodophyticola]
MIKDSVVGDQRTRIGEGQTDDGLGPNSDIGARLRALYGAVQDEGVPDQLLDLLEKLDSAEKTQRGKDEAYDE